MSVQLRDGDVTHSIISRLLRGHDVRLQCQCGRVIDCAPEHEVTAYALHLAAPQDSAGQLALLYGHAVQAVAVAQR